MAYNFVTEEPAVVAVIAGDSLPSDCHMFPALKPNFCGQKCKDGRGV